MNPTTPILDAFAQVETAAGHAKTTIRLNAATLRRLERETGIRLEEQTTATLTSWLAGHDWAPATRRSARNTLAVFYRWAYAEGLIDTDPARRLPTIREPVPAPRPIPDDDLAAALAKADERQALALLLGSRAGLRVSEAAAVNAADIAADLFGPTLRINGKGRKVRTVPIPDVLAERIRQAADAGPAGWAFPSRLDPASHVTPRQLCRIVRPILAPHGFHSLRHRYATATYSATGDLLAVCRLLGHSSPTITQRYVATDPGRLRQVALAAA